MLKNFTVAIFLIVPICINISNNINAKGITVSGTVVKRDYGDFNLYYLRTKDKKEICLGSDQDVSVENRQCVKTALGTKKIITVEGDIYKDREGDYAFWDYKFNCKNTINSKSKNEIKTGIFNFVNCDPGIGSSMGIFVTDLKTEEEYLMMAYKNTEIGDICELKSGMPLKIKYEYNTENNHYIIHKIQKK